MEISGKATINYSKFWSRWSLAFSFEDLCTLVSQSPSVFSRIFQQCGLFSCIPERPFIDTSFKNHLGCAGVVWNDILKCVPWGRAVKGAAAQLAGAAPQAPDHFGYYFFIIFFCTLLIVNLDCIERDWWNKCSANSSLYVSVNELWNNTWNMSK